MVSGQGADHTDELHQPDPETEQETESRQQTDIAEKAAGPGAGEGPDLTEE